MIFLIYIQFLIICIYNFYLYDNFKHFQESHDKYLIKTVIQFDSLMGNLSINQTTHKSKRRLLTTFEETRKYSKKIRIILTIINQIFVYCLRRMKHFSSLRKLTLSCLRPPRGQYLGSL